MQRTISLPFTMTVGHDLIFIGRKPAPDFYIFYMPFEISTLIFYRNRLKYEGGLVIPFYMRYSKNSI